MNLNDLRIRHMLPKPHDLWRTMPDTVGAIHGLPTLRGIAFATNGILVAIQQDKQVVFGHLDWFEKDKSEAPRPSAKRQTRLSCLDEFVEYLNS